MIEVKEHIAYELLEKKYNRICLDYVILMSDEPYKGFDTQKEAVIEAFEILNKRFEPYDYHLDIHTDKMKATISSIKELLSTPPENHTNRTNKSFSLPYQIPYWYAFLNPPHGTQYNKSDFIDFNAILFPNKNSVEVYRWNNDFSNYFDAGKEWWGTGLWTTFDSESNIIVVIGASLTD